MHKFIKTHELGIEWIIRDGVVIMLIMDSANEAELIFWNTVDQRRVPVRGGPRQQGCYVLAAYL